MKPSSKYVQSLDWFLRVTGVFGLISFADNLEQWARLFSQIGQWVGRFSWGELLISGFTIILSLYEITANTLFGWVPNLQARDLLMLWLTILGIVIVRKFVLKRRFIVPLQIYVFAITFIYLGNEIVDDAMTTEINSALDFALSRAFAWVLIIFPPLMIPMYSWAFFPRTDHLSTNTRTFHSTASARLLVRYIYAVIGITCIAVWSYMIAFDYFDRLALASFS